MIVQEFIDFWFKEIEPARWWIKETSFDNQITDKFLVINEVAKQGELVH
tara:strand:- start:3240 stop:3386 length:147 start_codon:yes stop_codon:yes gene_type:complete